MMKKVLSIALFSGVLTSAAVAEINLFAGGAIGNTSTQIKNTGDEDGKDSNINDGALTVNLLGGFGYMMEQNLFAVELGIGTGNLFPKDDAFKYTYEFDATLRYGHAFERFMPYLNLGIMMRNYKVEITNDKKTITHFAVGLGAEAEIMKNVKMFGEFNYIVSGKDIVTGFKANQGSVLKVGARYYFPM